MYGIGIDIKSDNYYKSLDKDGWEKEVNLKKFTNPDELKVKSDWEIFKLLFKSFLSIKEPNRIAASKELFAALEEDIRIFDFIYLMYSYAEENVRKKVLPMIPFNQHTIDSFNYSEEPSENPEFLKIADELTEISKRRSLSVITE